MMKKIYLITISFLLMGAAEGMCQSPIDIAYHAVPGSPAIEIKSEVISVGKQGVITAKNVGTLQTEAQTAKNNLQLSVTSTFNKIASGAVLNLNGEKSDTSATFYGKELTKVKAQKITEKLKEILLVYESRHDKDIKDVDRQRYNFYLDNIYAINAVAETLYYELTQEEKPKIERSKECAEGNGEMCGIPGSSSGGKNEVWFTYGETLAQYDRLVKMWETVAALKARLAAVKALMKIDPAVKLDSDAAPYETVTDKKQAEEAFYNQ